MKTDLKAKLLQHYVKKNGNKGFTLIELLVVVIIIGILAAVALPSMLSQANKAREAGAQSQLGAVNRAQQAYRLENTVFASNSTDLGMGTTVSTDDFTITINTGSSTAATAAAAPKDSGSGLKFFAGCVTQSSGTTSAEIKEGTSAPTC